MDRIDQLKNARRERLARLTGRVLDDTPDDELDAIVREASEATGAPIGLVSLVLERTQFFRAHVGLPPGLATTRATDRDISFCQLVVADDAPIEVANAPVDARVPQDLVERYGIRAYLGAPVRVAGVVVGSLCVIDTVARTFTVTEKVRLEEQAERASARLTDLAALPTSEPLLSRAAAPVFGELRNALAPLRVHVALGRVAINELRAVRRLAELSAAHGEGSALAAGALAEQAGAAFGDLEEAFNAVDEVSMRIQLDVLALEQLHVDNPNGADLEHIVIAAARLAHHRTKVEGGVTWPDLPRVGVAGASTTAVATLAAVLRLAPLPAAPSVHLTTERVELTFRDGDAELHAVSFAPTPSVSVRAEGGSLVVSMARESAGPSTAP